MLRPQIASLHKYPRTKFLSSTKAEPDHCQKPLQNNITFNITKHISGVNHTIPKLHPVQDLSHTQQQRVSSIPRVSPTQYSNIHHNETQQIRNQSKPLQNSTQSRNLSHTQHQRVASVPRVSTNTVPSTRLSSRSLQITITFSRSGVNQTTSKLHPIQDPFPHPTPRPSSVPRVFQPTQANVTHGQNTPVAPPILSAATSAPPSQLTISQLLLRAITD